MFLRPMGECEEGVVEARELIHLSRGGNTPGFMDIRTALRFFSFQFLSRLSYR